MRTFTLINGKGELCNITSPELFFNEPTGLGFDREETFRQVGDRWIRVSKKSRQGTISGNVAILGEDPYLAYFNFVRFLQNEPLTLLYCPNPTGYLEQVTSSTSKSIVTYSEYKSGTLPSLFTRVDDGVLEILFNSGILSTPPTIEKSMTNTVIKDPIGGTSYSTGNNPAGYTYRKNVTVSRLEKTELEQAGFLKCNISFTSLTPWYRLTAISNGDVDQEDILKWGIHWGINWGPMDEYSKGITSDSFMESPCKLTIYGPVENPRWIHYVNGYIYSTGQVDATIDESEYLLVDNTSDPYRIQKRSVLDDSLITDLYSASVFTTKRFVDIQNGINTISVTDQSDPPRNPIVKVEAQIYYESV